MRRRRTQHDECQCTVAHSTTCGASVNQWSPENAKRVGQVNQRDEADYFGGVSGLTQHDRKDKIEERHRNGGRRPDDGYPDAGLLCA